MNYIKGCLYGIFSICPGLSGGLLAIQFGDYQKLLTIINKKDFKINNIIYLFALFIGFISGSAFFSNVVIYLYSKFNTVFIIIIIVINIFLLITFIKKFRYKFSKFVTMFIISMFLILVIKKININFVGQNTFFLYFISGIIFSFSKIVPGVSGTTLLINVNFYKNILSFFSNPFSELFYNFNLWIVFWLTFIIFSFILIKILFNYQKYLNDISVIVMIICILNLII